MFRSISTFDPTSNVVVCLRHDLTASAGAAGDVKALAGGLTARDLVARPRPVRARALATEDVGVGTGARHADGVGLHNQASNGDAGL